MDLMEFAKSFGFPGLIVIVWFVLEQQKGKRAEKIEDKKIAIEEKKADAMTAGFTSLSGKLDAHHTADIQSHTALATEIAELHGKVDQALVDRTPVEGVPRVSAGYYGPSRPKSQGDR